MSSSLLLFVLIGAAAALGFKNPKYAPAVKEYGNYGNDRQPSYYGFHPENKYAYAPYYGGYGHKEPSYSHYVPKYGYDSYGYGHNVHGYGAPSYGFSKYGYGVPSYGYGHPSAYEGYGEPRYSSPIPYGFPKGYGSYGKYEAPAYGHPAY